MKHSKVIKEGLLFYGRDDFMCHVLSKMSRQINSPVSDKQVSEIKGLIFKRLDDMYTLNCYLRKTNESYSAMHEADTLHGWEQPEMHAMRIEFWKGFIAELEAKGL